MAKEKRCQATKTSNRIFTKTTSAYSGENQRNIRRGKKTAATTSRRRR